jgi:hypothetical protein
MWHRVHRSVACDPRGVAADVTYVYVVFPARVLRWGYSSQGKGSISSKL